MPLKERISCQWPWGGIVVRKVFPRRQHIDYYTTVLRSWYWSNSRTGAQGTGRFGGVHRT